MDATHDVNLRSWVASAAGHETFPVQNLPIGIFAPPGGVRRGGIAIGDSILDLKALCEHDLLEGDARAAAVAASDTTLNEYLAKGAARRRALRGAVSRLLCDPAAERKARACVHAAAECTLHVPAEIGDYTDFYAGIHHAEAVGRLFRPGAPMLPNYKYVPIGYHGRASSIRASGAEVRRPHGQLKGPDDTAPVYAASRRLDFELELGIWVGPGSALGEPVRIGRAAEHIAGFCLLNDWSARDIQAWESQPLGPFLAKNFLTSISTWIISPEALEPFRRTQPPRPTGDPQPLAYLWDLSDQTAGALDLELTVDLYTPTMRRAGSTPVRLTASNSCHLYWTVAQLLAHHTSGGCNLRAGDLFGTGTLSGPEAGGSLLELSRGGAEPILLANGETRTFLEDGDEIILNARAVRAGFAPLGFGECRGRIVAS